MNSSEITIYLSYFTNFFDEQKDDDDNNNNNIKHCCCLFNGNNICRSSSSDISSHNNRRRSQNSKWTTTTTTNTANNSNKNTAVKVHAGEGNSTDMLSVFVPQKIQVSVGQTVIWDNPTTVAEPHTVTFVLDNKTMTDIVSPLVVVPNSTRFEAIPPNSNNEPLKVAGPNNVVIAINARTYIPTVIDSQGNAKHLPPPNASLYYQW